MTCGTPNNHVASISLQRFSSLSIERVIQHLYNNHEDYEAILYPDYNHPPISETFL